jgi:hypothetical protein
LLYLVGIAESQLAQGGRLDEATTTAIGAVNVASNVVPTIL